MKTLILTGLLIFFLSFGQQTQAEIGSSGPLFFSSNLRYFSVILFQPGNYSSKKIIGEKGTLLIKGSRVGCVKAIHPDD